MLTSKATSAVVLIRQRGYALLAERMQAWFRQFLDTSVQEAVADLFLARLDAFLAMPVDISRQERLAFMEADEFADAEAPNEEPADDTAPGDDEEHNPDDE
jgi:serine/threonine protein kinase HipA of HipAB toxin-antitoxin module